MIKIQIIDFNTDVFDQKFSILYVGYFCQHGTASVTINIDFDRNRLGFH